MGGFMIYDLRIRMKRVLILFLLPALLLTSQLAHAQGENSLKQWRRGTAIVIFSGVGGGVLGLSTLSFYGEPQEHTGNITTGALVGLLAGLTYVIYDSSREEKGWTFDLKRDGTPLVGYRFRF